MSISQCTVAGAENQGLRLANPPVTPVENTQHSERLANLSPPPEHGNAAAAGTRDGVKIAKKADKSNDTRSAASRAMAKYCQPAHKSVARVVLAALTLGDFDAYANLVNVVRARLTPQERVALAWSAMRALDDDEADAVLRALWGARA